MSSRLLTKTGYMPFPLALREARKARVAGDEAKAAGVLFLIRDALDLPPDRTDAVRFHWAGDTPLEQHHGIAAWVELVSGQEERPFVALLCKGRSRKGLISLDLDICALAKEVCKAWAEEIRERDL